MSIKEILIKARSLIEKPENWCQGTYEKGEALCALKALDKAGDKDGSAHAMMVTLSLNGHGESLVPFNDSHSHAEVLALFDEAIEACP